MEKYKSKLSPSSLRLYDKCERCFWLTQHKIWRRHSGIFPSLPSGMDRVIKTHFDTFRDKGNLPPEIANNHQCKNMELFKDMEKLKVWRKNFVGISFTDENGNILRGAVDDIMVNKENNKLIVVDYKTKGWPVKDIKKEKVFYQNQMNIYAFLLKKNGYEVEDFGFLLFYTPNKILKTGEIIFNTILIKMDVEPIIGEDLWYLGKSLLHQKCPKQKCDFCQVVKNPNTYKEKLKKKSLRLAHPNGYPEGEIK